MSEKFFFNNENSFINMIRNILPEDRIAQFLFDRDIMPLCQKQFLEEEKIRILLSDSIIIKIEEYFLSQGTKNPLFYYSDLWTSSDFIETSSIFKGLSKIQFNVQWYDKEDSIFIFDIIERDRFTFYNIPTSDSAEGQIFNSIIYHRMKYIVDDFKDILINKLFDIQNIDKILNEIYENNIFDLKDSLIFDTPKSIKEIHNIILDHLEISFLINDSEEKKIIDLKTKTLELIRENNSVNSIKI